MHNYYEILGVAPEADERTIKAAYKQLALVHHPDRNPGNPHAEEQFKQINEAYQVLANPAFRARYDYLLQKLWEQSASEESRPAGSRYTSTSTATPNFSDFIDDASLSPRERRKRERAKEQAKHSPQEQEEHKRRVAEARDREAEAREREDAKGAWIAIGAMAVLLGLAVAIVQIGDYLSTKELEEGTRYYTDRMEQMRTFHSAHEGRLLWDELKSLDAAEANVPIYALLADLKVAVRAEANLLLQQTQYAESANFHELWRTIEPGDSLIIDGNLIHCYAGLNNFYEAKKLIEKLMRRNNSRIDGYHRMARLYAQDPTEEGQERAYLYYDSTATLIINEYISNHGRAYAIMMTPSLTPELHYEVFWEKAKMHVAKGEYKKAESSAYWATGLREQRPEAYFWLGKAMQGLGAPKSEICQQWQKAADLGEVEALEEIKQYCQ